MDASRFVDALETYDVDTATGFLPPVDPLVAMPEPFADIDEVAQRLPSLLRAGRVRDAIRAMPEADLSRIAGDAERERLFLTLCVLTNAWVWSDASVDLTIPANLAVPVCTLADRLGRQPIVSHASMALQNWRRVDPDLPIDPDNLELLVGFHGGTDETWFFTAALGVEMAAVPILVDIHAAVNAGIGGDLDAVGASLGRVADAMPSLTVALERTRDWCDPYAFYRRLRPYLAGWPEPGVIYDGVSATPRILAGGSAGQSSVIQVLDAAFGIEHAGVAGTFLTAMRAYMPPPHRRLIADVAERSTLRSLVGSGGGAGIGDAYDSAVAELDRFRRHHIRLSVDYVRKPSNDTDLVGTGGSDFVELLRDARTDTTRARVP